MTDLAKRYGTRRRRPWLLPAVAAIAFAVAIAWVFWVATAEKPFQTQVHGYTVTGEHETVVELTVHRPKPRTIECTVYAQAFDHSIVGERTITIEPSTTSTIRVKTAIVTERRAVTGTLKGCTVVP